jgi:hypothetical protein
MEVVFEVEKSEFSKARDVLLKDEMVAKASVIFKDASTFGIDRNVYFVYVAGLDEACGKAKELMKELGKEVSDDLKEQIVSKIKQEEDSAATGFGSIFG